MPFVPDSAPSGFVPDTPAKPAVAAPGQKPDWKKGMSALELASSAYGMASRPDKATSEAIAATGSGMVAPVVGNIAGLAAKGREVIAPSGGDPEAFRHHVTNALTYQPRIPAGQAMAEYNPMALIGKAVGAVGGGVKEGIQSGEPSRAKFMLGNVAEEAINQAPGLIGAKYGPGAVEGASGLMRSKAEGLMQSALKPTLKALKSGDAAIAINTMLDKGISLSKGGIAKMRAEIDALNDKISEAVATSTGKVKVADVYPMLKEKLDAFKKQVNPNADVKAIQDAWEEFRNHPLIAGAEEIPVPLAQELKQGTNKILSKKYGEQGSAAVEAQKAITRGLKEGVAANAPEVVEFNREESRLLRTLPQVERRVLMDANKNPMGLSLLAKNPASWAAFMLDKSATFKSMMARVLNASRTPVSAMSGVPAPLGVTTSLNAENQQ